MLKYLLGITLVILFAFNQALSSSSKIFEDHKLQTYTPHKAGVKDMLFDLRMEGLIERVKRSTSLTNLDDLYFRIYWAYPNQYRIDVEGLPKGFNGLKKSLVDNIKPFVDLIFADEYIKQFERINFVKDVKGNAYVKKKFGSDVNDIRIVLNNKNILDRIESKSPYSKVVTSFKYGQKSWSNGKHIVNEMEIKELSSGVENVRTISIERELYSGIGLPKKVILDQELRRAEKTINKSIANYNFSNYVINTGKALRILKGQKK